MTWLQDHIWPAEGRHVSDEFAHDGSALAMAEMLRGGTTCVNDMYFFPEATARAALRAGMRASLGIIAVEFPSAYATDASGYLHKGLATRDAYQGEATLSFCLAPHAPYTVADATLERIAVLAEELDLPIHTHVHETAAEIEEAVAATGQRPLERLERLGLVTPALVGVHATELKPREIEKLAQARANIVHCPRSNMKLASGACPVAALLEAGINVALGTDGAASNNRLDMWSEMQLAALLGKHVARTATAVPAATALQMATINAARALNLDAETGSLAPGKAADAICVELSGPGQVPMLNVISQLVYSASRDLVTDVWVAGQHLVADRALTRVDMDALERSARSWAERVMSA